MSRFCSRFDGRNARRRQQPGKRPAFRYETQTLIARMTTKPSDAHARAIDKLLSTLIVSGAYATMDAFYVMAAQDEQAASLNWIADAYNLTLGGSPTFTAYKGYTPNGSSTYLDTGFNPTTAVSPKFVQNSAHMFAWHLTAVDASFDIGNTNSRITKPGTANVFSRANNASNLSAAGSYTTHKGWVRTASNAAALYISGVSAATATTASAALTNYNFGIGRTSATEFGASQAAIVHFGSQLTAAQVLAVYTGAREYGLAVGMI
jgi:hypothetical protein